MISIIIWITQSIFWALWMVVSKLALQNKNVWNNFQTFFSRSAHIVIIALLFFTGILEFQSPIWIFWIKEWLLLFWSWAALYFTYFLRREAYGNEKVSVLQPFAMIFQIFPIIFGFIFIASERTNIITFFMALVASAVVIIPSIDFKNFKMNRYCSMVLLSSTIKSVQIFIVLYLISILDSSTFYFIESFYIVFMSVVLMIWKKQLWDFKKVSLDYAKILFTANAIWIISILLVLTMYTSIGIVATSLISLLYLVFVYLFWYLILKEIPEKKDVIIAFVVSICIIVWMFFKA